MNVMTLNAETIFPELGRPFRAPGSSHREPMALHLSRATIDRAVGAPILWRTTPGLRWAAPLALRFCAPKVQATVAQGNALGIGYSESPEP